MHKQRIFILVAAAVGVIGLILPWQSATLPFLGTVSVNAFESGWVGYATIAGIIGAAGVLFKDSDKSAPLAEDTRKIVLGAGGAAAGFSLLGIIIIASGVADAFGIGVSVGIGPIITLLAGGGIVAVPFIVKGDGSVQMPNNDVK